MSADSSQEPENLLTVKEALAYLGVPRTTLYEWLDRGYLQMVPAPTFYTKPRRYFTVAELDRFKREGPRAAGRLNVAETHGEYRTTAAS